MSATRPSRPLAAALLALAAGGAIALPAPAGAAKQLPALLSCANKRLIRPRGLVVLACADANAELISTQWKTWTASSATGTTKFGLNLCTPDCAASRISDFADSTVRLSQPTQTSHGLIFEKVTVRYMQGGKTRTYSE